jgi:hypothetical protein
MNGKKAFVVLAVATAMGVLGTAPAHAQDNGRNSGRERGGWVVPCSLVGVNPVYHPEIFGNPAAAASYGFVRSRNGAWQVRSGCRRR